MHSSLSSHHYLLHQVVVLKSHQMIQPTPPRRWSSDWRPARWCWRSREPHQGPSRIPTREQLPQGASFSLLPPFFHAIHHLLLPATLRSYTPRRRGRTPRGGSPTDKPAGFAPPSRHSVRLASPGRHVLPRGAAVDGAKPGSVDYGFHHDRALPCTSR